MHRKIANALRAGMLAAVLALASVPVLAAPPPSAGGGWDFTASVYLWGAGLSGDVAQFGLPPVHMQAEFSEILDNLDFALMVAGEARKERISLFGDVMYTKVSPGAAMPGAILATRVELTSETTAALFGAGYTVLRSERGHLDLVAAARWWRASTELAFTGGVLDGVARSDSDQWVDVLAGARGKYHINERFYLAAWAMAGAGGADLDWDAGALVGYEVSDGFAVAGGYRAAGVDYREDGFLFDVVQQGLVLGAVFRF